MPASDHRNDERLRHALPDDPRIAAVLAQRVRLRAMRTFARSVEGRSSVASTVRPRSDRVPAGA